MINPEWYWDEGDHLGYLDLMDRDPKSTQVLSFNNLALYLDLDSEGNLVGVEVLG